MKRMVWILALLLGPWAEAWAQEPFGRIASDIRSEYGEALKEQQRTLQEIENRRRALQEKLAAIEAERSSAYERLAADRGRLEELSRERDRLAGEVSRSLADDRELDMLFLNYARNFLALAEKSPYSAERPARLQVLRSFMDPNRVFRLKDLTDLLALSFEDMEASGEKVAYAGDMVDRSGRETMGQVIRLGHLQAMYRADHRTGYLNLSPASGRLVMSADPSYWIRRNLVRYFDGKTERVYADVSGGSAIRRLAQRIDWIDQLRSGGVLVIPILLVGLVALGLTAERLIFLSKVRHNTDDLMTRVTELVGEGNIDGAVEAAYPHRGRPTGRVLMAGLQHRGDPGEVIESALSEAILRETPRLERFLGALKVCAAVAPLLGLLGTVTGMINTFQVITTHGTGDPRLMAGGISEAMVTTQVGLAVAVPVMIVVAFLGRRARNLAHDMEEKGLALMGALLRLQTNGNSRAA